MKAVLQLRTSADIASKYRHLLCGEWDRAALRETIELVNWQLPDNSNAVSVAFDGTLFEPWPDPESDAVISQRFKALAEANAQPYLPALPARLKPRKGKAQKSLWEQTIGTSAALVAPSFHELQGNVDLFFDSLSLLFLVSIHVLLPALTDERFSKERALLINAKWIHCQTVWVNEIAQQQYLLACLYRSISLRGLEETALRNCFQLTDSSDHDFVSKAQAVWNCLLDQRHTGEARTFILQAARRAPEAALAELSEMIGDTLPKAESA